MPRLRRGWGSSTMTKAIELHGLAHAFGSNEVLKDVSMVVPEGSVYAFLGRNGAGKSTTIKLMLGLLERTAGTVKVLGLDPDVEGQVLMKYVGYVSEDLVLYDWMTAAELIELTASFYDCWDEELEKSLVRKLRIKLDRKYGKMSRGEQGRLKLLLALAHRPTLLVLDEPAAGLDAVVRREFLNELIELAAQEGRTIFISSHLIDEVERVADNVAILSQGRIVADCPVADLKHVAKTRLGVEAEGMDVDGMSLEDLFVLMTRDEDEEVRA